MSLSFLASTQQVKVFDNNTQANWTFSIDWLQKRVEVYRESTRLAVFNTLPSRINVTYLHTLINQFENVRNLA